MLISRHATIALLCFFFQAEDGIRDLTVTGVQTCALPISGFGAWMGAIQARMEAALARLLPQAHLAPARLHERSEEHTSELQSQSNLVCRLLLEKKKDSFRHQSAIATPVSTPPAHSSLLPP